MHQMLKITSMGGKIIKDKYIVIPSTMKQEQIAENSSALLTNKRKKAGTVLKGFKAIIKQDWENAAKTAKESTNEGLGDPLW